MEPTPEEIVKKVTDLAHVYLSEREAYGTARIEWHKAEEKTLRIINEGDFSRLENEEARRGLRTAVEEGRLAKLTIADKQAIAHCEHEELFDKYDTAKFNCATTEKAFDMFNALLIWHQSKAKTETAYMKYTT